MRRHLSPCGLCQLPVGEGEEQQELQDINILLDSVVKLHIKHRQQQAAQLSAQLSNITATTDRNHQLTQLQQQQQQRSSSLDTIYINTIDTVDHLAATADTSAEASDITAEERQRKQAADIRAAVQRGQQQQQQQQRSPSEAQHQDPSPRPRRQHHRENGEEARSERGPSVTSRRSRTSSPGRQEGKERRNQEGERRIRPHRQPSTAIVAIRQSITSPKGHHGCYISCSLCCFIFVTCCSIIAVLHQ